MSTTAVVSPYDLEVETAANELAIREEQALARYREELRRNRIKGQKLPLCESSKVGLSQSSITLRTGSVELIARAANTAGFSLKALAPSKFELTHANGASISVSLNGAGRVVLSSRDMDLSSAGAKAIIREYSAIQVLKHLKSRKMNVTAIRTEQGEIAIEARLPNKNTAVTADIRQDGVAVVDVSGVKGPHCQVIIAGIAGSMDGSQIDTARKNEYFLRRDQKKGIHV
ncbi:MAG TPA: DUF2997 domain-containing protein [Proteobacteria bacterium]|nr:DUF2997 domain-containing protein [Pseudomonadota bacterium]